MHSFNLKMCLLVLGSFLIFLVSSALHFLGRLSVGCGPFGCSFFFLLFVYFPVLLRYNRHSLTSLIFNPLLSFFFNCFLFPGALSCFLSWLSFLFYWCDIFKISDDIMAFLKVSFVLSVFHESSYFFSVLVSLLMKAFPQMSCPPWLSVQIEEGDFLLQRKNNNNKKVEIAGVSTEYLLVGYMLLNFIKEFRTYSESEEF